MAGQFAQRFELLFPREVQNLTNHIHGGGGSDQRRKSLVTSIFGSQDLFIAHRHMVRDAYRDLSINVEAALRNAVTRRTTLIDADLQLLQDENVVLESERKPVFRRKLVEEIEQAKAELEQMSSRLEAELMPAHVVTSTPCQSRTTLYVRSEKGSLRFD